MVRTASVLLSLLVATPAFAARVDVLDVRTEPDPATFGERVELVIEVERDGDARLSLPAELPDTPALRRVGAPVRAAQPVAGAPDRVRESFRVPFLALDMQDLKTPELTLVVEGGEPLQVGALEVQVAGADKEREIAPPSPQELAQILSPAQQQATFSVVDARPLVLLFAFAFGGLALLGYTLLARRRRLLVPAAAPVLEAAPAAQRADEVALARLDALLAEGLLARGEIAPFVQRLMDDVLRDYLERRYEVAAGRRTTSELAEDLLSTGAPGLDLALVRKLLDDADLVKFARAELASDVAHGMAAHVRTLIEATRPEREAA